MPYYNPDMHHRRSIRLKGYDYSQEGLYYITICSEHRAHIFGEVINHQMVLNSFGEIAFNQWLHTEKVRPNCKIHDFIIMPNHLHGIIEIIHKNTQKITSGKFQSPSQTIGSIVRGYKIAVIKEIKNQILNRGGFGRGEFSKGELQFAPTEPAPTEPAPTEPAPTEPAPTEIIKKIKALDFKIWQRDYYESIIRDYISLVRISNYIKRNPANWKDDRFFDGSG